MARLQRKIWEGTWSMWMHRNTILHGEEEDLAHQHEIQSLNEAITAEWNRSIDILPHEKYSNLFSGTLQQRLDWDLALKQQWISSVWLARERHGNAIERHRCPIASAFYKRRKATF